MQIGIVSDLHYGYSHGTRVDKFGVNQREADVYAAGRAAIDNLIDGGAEIIVDLGDMAEVPSPKKRAVWRLIQLVERAGVEYYSANGNHTLQRTASDIHLYNLLTEYTMNFNGYLVPTFVEHIGGLFLPYDSAENIRKALIEFENEDIKFIAGHWACGDVPFPGDHLDVSDLPVVDTFLGHYHTRKRHILNHPTYIGATERFAWGEWQNPTGAAIWDTDTGDLTFIEHETRRWLDIYVNPDDYLEESKYEQVENAVVRVNIDTTAEQYAALDLVGIRKRLAPALEFQIRRKPYAKEERAETISTGSVPLIDSWNTLVNQEKLKKEVKEAVRRIGEEALRGSSV